MNRNKWKQYVVFVIPCVIAVSFFLAWRGGFFSLPQLKFSVLFDSPILDTLLSIIIMGIISIFCGMLSIVDKEEM